MPRYLVPTAAIRGSQVMIEGDLARHLAHSLRLAPGQRITVADESGLEHGVHITVVGTRIEGDIAWSRAAKGEPQMAITVVHALIREFDDVVAGLTHAGAARIVPVVTVRSVVRPEPSRVASRRERWRTIAREAAQLAGRVRVPAIASPVSLAEALPLLPTPARLLTCTIDGSVSLAAATRGAGDVTLVIGPEGGLGPDEFALLDDAGGVRVHMGPRVMPARSAGQIAVTLTLAALGDLETAATSQPW